MPLQFMWHKGFPLHLSPSDPQAGNNLADREGPSLQQFIAFAVREKT